VVQESVEDWSEHVGEDVFTHEVGGVLDHNNCELDGLMHAECYEPVVVVQEGVSELNVHIFDNEIKITLIVKSQIESSTEVKIFENKLNWGVSWN
jgi:predicted ATP-grasp superfamily ATP-dependent carboligase